MTDAAKEARRAYLREYKRAHAEHINAYNRAYRKDHPEQFREYRERYWEKRAQEMGIAAPTVSTSQPD